MKTKKERNMFDTAEVLLSMMENEGMTQEKLSKEFGVSQSYIANKLRLLRLGPDEREKILKSALTERHVRALIRLRDKEKRTVATDTVIREGMNVQKTEMFVDKIVESEREDKTFAVPTEMRMLYETAKLCGAEMEYVEREDDTVCVTFLKGKR